MSTDEKIAGGSDDRSEGLPRPCLLRPVDQADRRETARYAGRQFCLRADRAERRAARAAPDLAICGHLQMRGVREHRAVADAEPRRARRADPPADREFL